MKLVRMVVAMFGATYIAGTLAHPYIDGDLFWQRWLGEQILRTGEIPRALGLETFAAVGAPWLAQEWLFSTLYALAVAAHGAWLFHAAVGACVAMTLFFVARRTSARAGTLASVIAIVLCGISLDPSLGVRAQDVGWLCFAALLCVFDYEDARVFWAVPLVIAWANLHASAVVALPVVAIDLLVTPWRDGRALRRRLLLFIALAVALCIGPFGVALPMYALHVSSSPIRTYIVEWQSWAWSQASFVLVVLPVFAILVVRFRQALQQPRELLRVVLFLAMSCMAIRNVALLGIAAAPLIAILLDPWLSRVTLPSIELSARAKRRTALGVSVVLLLVFGLSYRFATLPNGGRLPFAAMRFIARLPGERRLYCTDFAWCSMPLGQHRMRVYLDGRADPFPWYVWRRYVRIARGGSPAVQTLERIRANTVIAGKDSALVAALLRQPSWRRVYVGSLSVVFVRNRSNRNVRSAATRNPT